MSNKIFNYRYRGTATAFNYGQGNFNIANAAGYNTISSLVTTTPGSEQRFAYSITFASSSSVFEYGIGYLTDIGGGIYQFSREQSLSSSQGDNSKVNILSTYGAVYVDIVSPNPNYTNYKRINSNSTLANVNSTYFIDAATDLTISLPAISTDAVIIGIALTSLSGAENERTDAVTLDAVGADTINDVGTYALSKKNDFVRIMSDIDNNNWVVLDPIQDTASASGPNGAVQLSDGGVLGHNNGFFFNDDAVFVGGDDATTAVVQIGGQLTNTVFNLQSGNIDFAINSNGVGNAFFVDASANSIGINTSTPFDILNVNTTGIEGITISTSTSGSIPTLSFNNNDPDFAEGLDIGRIDFVGPNTAAEAITYSRVISEALDATDSSEEGLLKLLVNNNGTLQIVTLLSYEDIQIGPNNSISGGIIIGSNTTNQGDNVCIGYYNTNCGTSSINIGHQNTIESGSYAGAIGSSHTVTGSHIWLFGGSGADITGNNSTFLLSNDNNYIQIKHDQQQRVGIYVDSTGTHFNIVNTRISQTGTQHLQNIMFRNSAGDQVTGVSQGVVVLDPSQSGEYTSFFLKVLDSGNMSDVIDIGSKYVSISNISGLDDTVFIGRKLDISGTGTNNTVVGISNIISDNSGENTIVGYGNELASSGNHHIITVGNSNTSDENYSTTIGISNKNSGLYSAVVGYNNGIYGENISIVGVNNDVSGNNSSVLGYQNNIDNKSCYVLGQGNSSIYSGVTILGNDVTALGHRRTYIKNQSVIITGMYITLDTTSVSDGSINFKSRPVVEDVGVVLVSGDSISNLVNNSNYVSSGDNVSELVNDANYVSDGDNVSLLVNDAAYLTEIVQDTTPVLGGDLDAGGNGIANLTGISGPSNIISVGSHLVPDTSGTYDLGSSSLPWADLYIDTGTIRFVSSNGTQYALGVQNNDLVFNSNVVPDKTEVVLVTGTYTNPSWLNSISSTKLSGVVPSINLPSFVDEVEEYAGTGNFPAIGSGNIIYVDTLTTNSYRWGGTVYAQITASSAVWGNIAGTLSSQTDLYTAIQERAISGDNISIFTNDVNYVITGDNISVLTNDSNYVSSGDNISELTNDANYIASGNNISLLVNDASYVTSGSLVDSSLTFNVTASGTGAFLFDGAGMSSGIDSNPDLYLQKGTTYYFNINTTTETRFEIQRLDAFNVGRQYDVTGLINNTGIYNETITWTVRHDEAEQGYRYISTGNPSMVGNIYFTDQTQITGLKVNGFGDTQSISIVGKNGVSVNVDNTLSQIQVSLDGQMGDLQVIQTIDNKIYGRWDNDPSVAEYVIESIELKDVLDDPVITSISQTGRFLSVEMTADDTSTDNYPFMFISGTTNYIPLVFEGDEITLPSVYTGLLLIPSGLTSGDVAQVGIVTSNPVGVVSTTGLSTGLTLAAHGQPSPPVFDSVSVGLGGEIYTTFFIDTIPSTRGFYDFVDLEIELAPNSGGLPGSWSGYETLQASGGVDFVDPNGNVSVIITPGASADGIWYLRARTTNPLGSSIYVEYGE
jgi:hypothetical protein